MSNNGGRQELEKSLNLKDVIALAFGTMIGWGWVMLCGSWVANGGVMGAILAFLLGGVMALFVGLTYAELTPALPLAGGELVFSYRAMGYNVSYFCGWMITLAYLGVACWEGPALSNALIFLFGGADKVPGGSTVLYSLQGSDVTLTFLVVGMVGAIVMTVVNLKGAKASAIFQTITTVALAIGGIAFFVCGVATGSIKNCVPMFTDGAGLVKVILAVPAMFVGFDVIPQAAEEMDIPLGKIGKVMVIAIGMGAAWYILMIIGCAFSGAPEIRDSFTNDDACVPVAALFDYTLGGTGMGIFSKIMILCAMGGILSSWNGFIVGASRVLFSMSRAHMLPRVFSKVGEKSGAPTAAVAMVGILVMLAPLLGRSALVWFVDAAALGTVIAYTLVSLSYCILKKTEPELERPFRAPGGMATGVIAVVVALFMVSLYFPIYSPAPLTTIEWYLVGGWVVLGIIFYIINKCTANGKVTKQEVEFQMFGEKYSRKFD